MPKYELKINGENYTVEAESSMPLLWVLRDLVGLKGTKFGCGKGLCGSCTVHVGEAAVRSCSFPVSAVQDQKVKTIEGLAQESRHPLQSNWEKGNVPQCGYCQPGQIMSAAAAIQNGSMNKGNVKDMMNSNLCRCGTYQRIQEAILNTLTANEKE